MVVATSTAMATSSSSAVPTAANAAPRYFFNSVFFAASVYVYIYIYIYNTEFQFTKPECQPPLWFLKWWSIHGSQAEIIPDVLWNSEPPTKRGSPQLSTHTLKQALLHFTKSYRCTEHHSRYPPTLLLFGSPKLEPSKN